MGLRLTLRVFKGPDKEEFRRVFATEAERHGGGVSWDRKHAEREVDLRTTHQADVHTVFMPYLRGSADGMLCHLVGAALYAPWIEARIQEGTLWDYSLFNGAKHVDQFSTLPEYWGDEDMNLDEYRGNATLLAELWSVPLERVDRYLRNWGMQPLEEGIFDTVLKGKAYDSDRSEYGEIHQMFDFLAALGAIDPMAHGTLHGIVVPPVERLDAASDLLGS